MVGMPKMTRTLTGIPMARLALAGSPKMKRALNGMFKMIYAVGSNAAGGGVEIKTFPASIIHKQR
jgi:hypothetical protein